jgi:YVTN family beta-propeller protein
VELRLLGPLEVVDSGRSLEVGRGRESALLILLALRANEPVSPDQIVEGIWGDAPPENATKTVQVYISRLRRSLGADHIETVGRGYLLRIDGDDLDVVRFERLARRGSELLERGDARAAERTFAEAIALWRGEALADVRYEAFAQPEIRRLDELRAAVSADRVDALLALGREDEAVAATRRLVEAQPLWERPRQQLMLGLYRSGRQAEALDVYREARRTLDEELALQPSAELQELERRILNHDQALGGGHRLHELTRRRRGAALVLGGAALVVAGAVAGAVVIAMRGGSAATLTSIAPNSLGVIDPARDRLVGRVGLGSSATAVAAADDVVWVANAGRDQLVAVDPHSLRVLRTVRLRSTPTELAAGPTGVWVTEPFGAGAGRLTRVGTRFGVKEVAVRTGDVADLFAPSTPDAVSLDTRGVPWTNTVHGRLVSVTRRGVRVFELPRGHSIDGIAAGGGSIWIASGVDDSVLRFDPEAGRVVAVIRVAAVDGRRAAAPAAVAYGGGSVWVADALDDRVTRIDPRTQAVSATIPVGPRPTGITFGAGGVWTLNAGDGSVSHIDPSSNRVVATIPVGRVVTGIAASASRVWVSVGGGAAVESTPPSAPARPLRQAGCGPMEAGGGSPDMVIVSDLPKFDNGGKANPDVADMVAAIRLVVSEHGFRAGPYRIGYEACTDSAPGASPDPPLCAANARAYAENPSVVGVIGAHQSMCTGIELPILDTAPTGPVAVVSPSNTYVGLTHQGPQTAADEPERYYPTGVRNYVRVSSPDDGQGAALAELARELRRRRIFVLGDGDATSAAMSTFVVNAAHALGVGVSGVGQWGQSGPYRGLATRIRRARADAVVITGCICTNGGGLLVGLRKVLGPSVPFLASDNFTCSCDMGGPGAPAAAIGMYITIAGAAAPLLPTVGRTFVGRLFPNRPLADVSTFVPTAAAAAEALIRSIASSDGSRSDIVAQLTHGRLAGSPVGGVSFDANGDPTHAIFTVFRVARRAPFLPHVPTGGLRVDRVIDTDPALARGP